MVVLPESGWEMMARLRRRLISLGGAEYPALSVSSAVAEWSLVVDNGRDAGRKASAPVFGLQMHISDSASKSVDALALIDVVIIIEIVG
mmetsp:Transcript_22228/g.33689  ORF Transcript_22228/g.33689 Transcript_22228/m.33689 type:complete len:89 (+) Transcript_22228:85-351(+)